MWKTLRLSQIAITNSAHVLIRDVKRGSHTDVILVLPLEADLQIMILVDQVKEPLQEMITLLLSDTVDMTHVTSDGEDALPP